MAWNLAEGYQEEADGSIPKLLEGHRNTGKRMPEASLNERRVHSERAASQGVYTPQMITQKQHRMTQEQFAMLLPLACAWAEEQERIILREGVPLTPAQTADAVQIGVAHPKKVRLLRVGHVPVPEQPTLRAAAEATQLISPHTAGLTL